MHCPVCGTSNPDKNVFCDDCGARLQEEAEQAETAGETVLVVQPSWQGVQSPAKDYASLGESFLTPASLAAEQSPTKKAVVKTLKIVGGVLLAAYVVFTLVVLVGVCFFGLGGKLLAGQWYEWDDERIFFDSDGEMVKDGWVTDDEGTYYMDSDGRPYENQWLDLDGASYYFGSDGKMYVNQWLNYDRATYYFGPDGKMFAGQWYEWEGRLFYLGFDGKMVMSDWVSYDGARYYVAADGRPYEDQWLEIDGVWYHFDADGRLDDRSSSRPVASD